MAKQVDLNEWVASVIVEEGDKRYVKKESGKGLSTNDYTTAEKNKLAQIEAQANKINVDSSLSTNSENPVQNKIINAALTNKVDKETGKGLFSGSYNDLTNKPTIPTDTNELTNGAGFLTQSDIASLSGRITVEQQASPDSGYTATYVIRENGTQIGTKINIPKDFLVKSASLKTSSTNNSPQAGFIEGDKYLDFVINTKDGSDIDEHLYINVKDLFNEYQADEVTLTLSNNGTFSIKSGIIPQPSTTATDIKMNGIQSAGSATTWAKADHIHPVDTSRAAASHSHSKTDIIDFPTSMTPTSHAHGSITNDGTLDTDVNTVNKIVVTDNSKNIKTISKIPYNKIDNTPTIPDKTSQLTNDSGFITGSDVAENIDLTDYVQTDDTRLSDARTPTFHTHVKSDISNFPTKVSAFTNDSGYLTSHQDITGKADTSDLGTVAFSNDYTDLDNKPTIPSKTSDLTNDSGFLTTHQDISGKANISDLSTVATSGSYNDLSNKPSIPSDVSELTDTENTPFTPKSHTHTKNQITDFPTLSTVATTGDYDDLTDKPSIPSKTSDLTNDGDGTNVFVKNNDSRLSDNRTPTSHTHGNLQNDGKVGTSNNASKNVVTDSTGKITTEDKADLSVYATSTDLSNHNTSATAHNNIQIKPIEYIIGTQNSETNAWTGTSTKIASLSAGVCILYKLPYAGTTSNATLNLTLSGGGTSGAKAIYFTNTTRVKQQFGVNAIICLMYDGSYWRVINPYTNTTTNYYDRNRFQTTGVKIKTAFTNDYGLLCGDDTGYTHLGSGSTFDLSHPLLYYASTVDMEADTYTTNGYSNFGNIDATYIKANVTLTVDKMVYLVGTVSNNMFTVDSTIITQTPSTTGKVYLPIGLAISTTNIIFFPIYELVEYKNSNLVPYISSHTHTKSQITDFPTIPSKTSDLTNDSNFISTSSTNGLMKNDGTIDSNTYLTTSVASSTYVAKETGKGLFSGSYNDLTNKPSIPSAYTHPTPSGLGNAQTTTVLKKVAYDNQGHITSTSDVQGSDLPSHTHDDRYYTETEIQNNYVAKEDLEDMVGLSYDDSTGILTITFNTD